jgi:CheY-like chemotaxis protein
MIYGFVQQSGGQVTISSEVGHGTTVSLLFPRHIGEADVGAQPSGTIVETAAASGESVLILDDEITVRMLLTDVLADAGYKVFEAANGAEALDILQSKTPLDLMITDVGLPGALNGRQVATRARAHRPQLKILFITGYAETAAFSHEHLEPGMHVLTKPFAIDRFAARIRQILADS